MPGGTDASPKRPGEPAAPRRVTASQLYDFAVCEHRIALDARLDRSRRAPPDAALRLLFDRGLALERALTARLGYEAVEPDPAHPEPAFRRTLELMRAGARGISQGVLLDGRALAIPDLLRRAEGPSDLGGHHYEPGDVKSGRTPRTDQVLQVVFSAALLERIQGRRPERGFLLLADGSQVDFSVDAVWDSAVLARGNLELVADGRRETHAFLSEHCARCRWRMECLPALSEGPDLSFVSGMTRARQRTLRRHGVTNARELAGLTSERIADIQCGEAPVDGLATLQRQARALVDRTVEVRRSRPGRRAASALRRGTGLREHLLTCARDPLQGGEPFLFGYAGRRGPLEPLEEPEVLFASSEADRARALDRLLERIGSDESLIVHWGSGVRAAFVRIADRAGVDPARLGRIEGRFFDLAPVVRSSAFLPVRRPAFAEVAAALRGRPLPDLLVPPDELWVWNENARSAGESAPGSADAPAPGVSSAPAPGDGRQAIVSRVASELEDLAAVRDWVARTLEASR